MSEWKPIETAPSGTDVLVYCPLPGSEYEVVAILLPRGWVTSYEHEDIFDPSHWMPLPEPPTREGG